MGLEQVYGSEELTLKPIRRLSPSRYTAMRSCLLREVWIAADNEPLLSPSPSAELGSIIHELLACAGRRQLGSGTGDAVERAWVGLVLAAEKRMALSPPRRHLVPLSHSIPDYHVRRLRAFRRAVEIASAAASTRSGGLKRVPVNTGFEVWVESRDGQIGGYIDRVLVTPEGVVLSDYKSGAILALGKSSNRTVISQAYKEQLTLYAALFQHKFGIWPVSLELVPLQGAPVSVSYDEASATRLLEDACVLMREANRRVAEVKNGCSPVTELASPSVENCMFCLYRPACEAYWLARRQRPEARWPADVAGQLMESVRLRNGKWCMRISQRDSQKPSCVTVRNLTDDAVRHPLLHQVQPGTEVAMCGLHYERRSGDYTETQNTMLFVKAGSAF